ncbi:MAG: hydroxymethylbilane synthase, partial [Pseudomonadota bacterium]
MTLDRIRIGTRGSPLALAQAHETRDRLKSTHGLDDAQIEIVIIQTSGDRILDRPLMEVGGKGLFTKEIEEAMFRAEIDVAVHSMKDLETSMPDGLAVGAVLPREDVRDAFISLKFARLADVPEGRVIGTSSLRRRAQLRNARPDLSVVEFRGNVQTRLQKLADEVADATFLACAGLHRLGEEARITEAVATDDMLPAVAQGAIALQFRADDDRIRTALAP